MNEVNYAEKVIIPALQKRAQELLNNNLVLEVSLLVEQEKNRNMDALLKEKDSSLANCSGQLDGEITRATSFAHEANQLRSEISTMTARTNTLENDLRREISLKESILSEYKALKQSYDSLFAEHEAAKSRIGELEAVSTERESLIKRIAELEAPQVEKPVKKVSKAVANG